MKNPFLMAAATLLALGLAHTGSAQGQKLTLSGQAISAYNAIQSDLLEAAELMPEADYLFKPTPEMRPFGQLISHVALTQFRTCSLLQGWPEPEGRRKGGDTPLEGGADRAAQGIRDLLQSARQRHDGRRHGAVDEGRAQRGGTRTAGHQPKYSWQ